MGSSSNENVGNVVCEMINVKKYDKSETAHKVEMASSKARVIPGEASASLYKQYRRLFYRSNCNPSEVESLMVCPVYQSIKIFKATGQRGLARSYAEVIKGRQIHSEKLPYQGKSHKFWSTNRSTTNTDIQNNPYCQDFGNKVIDHDNKAGKKGEGAFSHLTVDIGNQNTMNIESVTFSPHKTITEDNTITSIKRTLPVDVIAGEKRG